MTDGRITNGRPAGHSGYALPGTKKPARTACRVLRELFDLIDEAEVAAGVIARETGRSYVSMSRWKHGRATPMITDVENIAQVLGYRLALVPIDQAVDERFKPMTPERREFLIEEIGELVRRRLTPDAGSV